MAIFRGAVAGRGVKEFLGAGSGLHTDLDGVALMYVKFIELYTYDLFLFLLFYYSSIKCIQILQDVE